MTLPHESRFLYLMDTQVLHAEHIREFCFKPSLVELVHKKKRFDFACIVSTKNNLESPPSN